MFYLVFASGSKKHILWLQKEIENRLFIKGHITNKKNDRFFQLKYAKKEALEVIKKMYYTPRVVCLSRKRLKIKKALEIERKQQKSYK